MKQNSSPHLSHQCSAGGGNASIRPFQCHPNWQAAGVPTGTYEAGSPHYMGYSSLDARVIKAIADSLAQIDRLLVSGRFTALAYSWNKETKLGGRLFDTAQIVRDHIVDGLEVTAAKHSVSVIRSEFSAPDRDGDFNYMITRQSKTLFVFNDNEEQFYAHYADPANPYGAR